MKLWEIPRINPETVVCIGGGPSLTAAQVSLTAHFYTIAVNNAFELAPWAQILYGCDARWWERYWEGNSQGGPGVEYFKGLKVGLGWNGPADKSYTGWPVADPEILRLRSTGVNGLELLDRSGLKTGENSGYQAINLAIQLGAKRIILIGYDMHVNGQAHWHGEHKGWARPPVDSFIPHFETIKDDLVHAGVKIINCTTDTRLTAFPMRDLEAAIDG